MEHLNNKLSQDNQSFKLFEIQQLAQIVRSNLILLIHDFFGKQEYVFVDPPILHEQIHNKKSEIYLSIYNNYYSLNSSNALYMGAFASLFKKVYAISPTFRDEQSSRNHLIEFRMLEVEVTNMCYEELLDLVESFIKFLLASLLDVSDLKKYTQLVQRIQSLLLRFTPQRISYINFINKLKEKHVYLSKNVDLSNVDVVISKFVTEPIFIIDYPKHLATWTAKSKSKDGQYMYAFNLLLPETYGELCEGCERTNDFSLLEYKMNCAGISNLQWYIEAVAKVEGPRVGFGIGIDRLIR